MQCEATARQVMILDCTFPPEIRVSAVSNSLELAARISVTVFVVLSSLSAGLRLSLQNVLQSLRSTRLVISALAANFILVPLVAFLITKAMPLEPSLAIALLLLGTASGAPMLPKLVEFARGDLALGVGLMALQMAGTILFMPFVLPMLLPGAHASAWLIARPLVVVIVPSLAAGLSLRAFREALSLRLQPISQLASNVALVVVILVAVLNHLSMGVGMGNLSAAVLGLIFFLISFGIGFALGGPAPETRKILALGTTVRSFSAAFLVALESFRETDVLNVLATLALLALVTQVPAALFLGSRAQRRAPGDGLGN